MVLSQRRVTEADDADEPIAWYARAAGEIQT